MAEGESSPAAPAAPAAETSPTAQSGMGGTQKSSPERARSPDPYADPYTQDFVDLNYIAPSVMGKIAQKRAFEETRRQRILNSKMRTIGIEVDILDSQVAAKKAQEQAIKEKDLEEENIVLAVDNQLKTLEVHRKRMHEEATRDVVDFNLKCMAKVDRREYDLSDPNALKKEEEVCEEDKTVSSLLSFAGEDPDRGGRIKAQHAQQYQWLEQQVYEKKVTKSMEQEADMDFASNQTILIQLRAQMEKEEAALRNDITRSALDYNESKRKEKEEDRDKNRFGRPLDERVRDYREMAFWATDPFLNETTDQYGPSGRIRRDHFRGMSRDEYMQSAALNNDMITHNKIIEDAMKAEEAEYDAMAEETRRALVLIEKERQKQYNETVHTELNKNKVMTLQEQKEKNKPNFGEIGVEYFHGFGKDHR